MHVETFESPIKQDMFGLKNLENNNTNVPFSYCSAFFIPSCSFSIPTSTTMVPNESIAAVDEKIKADAVSKELAFGCKIFQYAMLQDQKQHEYIVPAPLPPSLSPNYDQILLEKLLQLNNAISTDRPASSLFIKSKTEELYEDPGTYTDFKNFRKSSTESNEYENNVKTTASAFTTTITPNVNAGRTMYSNGSETSKVLLSVLNLSSKNKLGRTYNPGRPLGMNDRQKILELYQKGFKISHIAKIIGVTHSCVSKIMSRYKKTGSMQPRCIQLTENCSTDYKLNHPRSHYCCHLPSSQISAKHDTLINGLEYAVHINNENSTPISPSINKFVPFTNTDLILPTR